MTDQEWLDRYEAYVRRITEWEGKTPRDMAHAALAALEPGERPGMPGEAVPEDYAHDELSYMDWEDQ